MRSISKAKRSKKIFVALLAALTSALAQDVDALAARCRSGDSSACDSLAAMATGDASWQVRQSAVERLTDQTVLAKCAADDRDFIVRTAAVGRLLDGSSILKSLAGDLNHLTKDARENIARTKLGIADELIQSRFPGLQCSVDVTSKSRTYSEEGPVAGVPVRRADLRGELTTIKVTQGSETLAFETWSTDFASSAWISRSLSEGNREPLFGVTVSPRRLFTQLLRRPEFTSGVYGPSVPMHRSRGPTGCSHQCLRPEDPCDNRHQGH